MLAVIKPTNPRIQNRHTTTLRYQYSCVKNFGFYWFNKVSTVSYSLWSYSHHVTCLETEAEGMSLLESK